MLLSDILQSTLQDSNKILFLVHNRKLQISLPLTKASLSSKFSLFQGDFCILLRVETEELSKPLKF